MSEREPTGSYRLRDVTADRRALAAFISLLLAAALLGLSPAIASPGWSMLLFAGYIATTATLLLAAMYVTDRRLREVTA